MKLNSIYAKPLLTFEQSPLPKHKEEEKVPNLSVQKIDSDLMEVFDKNAVKSDSKISKDHFASNQSK